MSSALGKYCLELFLFVPTFHSSKFLSTLLLLFLCLLLPLDSHLLSKKGIDNV